MRCRDSACPGSPARSWTHGEPADRPRRIAAPRRQGRGLWRVDGSTFPHDQRRAGLRGTVDRRRRPVESAPVQHPHRGFEQHFWVLVVGTLVIDSVARVGIVLIGGADQHHRQAEPCGAMI